MAERKGSTALMVDSGFRRGTDVLKAMCLGADFVFMGRPFVYAVAVAGERGVAHAIALISDEMRRDMALMGVTQLRNSTEAICRRRPLSGYVPDTA